MSCPVLSGDGGSLDRRWMGDYGRAGRSVPMGLLRSKMNRCNVDKAARCGGDVWSLFQSSAVISQISFLLGQGGPCSPGGQRCPCPVGLGDPASALPSRGTHCFRAAVTDRKPLFHNRAAEVTSEASRVNKRNRSLTGSCALMPPDASTFHEC